MRRKVKIGYLTYTINELNETHQRMQGVYGCTDHVAQAIYLKKDLSTERYKEVLLHELMHAVYEQWIGAFRTEEEEPVVNQLGQGMSLLFKDNPWLKDVLF